MKASAHRNDGTASSSSSSSSTSLSSCPQPALGRVEENTLAPPMHAVGGGGGSGNGEYGGGGWRSGWREWRVGDNSTGSGRRPGGLL